MKLDEGGFVPTPVLQARVASFGLFTACISGAALVFRAVRDVSAHDPAMYLTVRYLGHELAVLIGLLVWLVTRRGSFGPRFLYWAEGIGLAASCYGYAAMGYGIERHLPWGTKPPGTSSHMVVLMAMTVTAFPRTLFIPSSARHTFWVTLASSAGLLLLASPLGSRNPYDCFGYPAQPFLGTALGAAMLWALVTACATAASGVVYGLRKQAHLAAAYGQYTLSDQIGEGGMGVVFRARHRLLRRPTAVKLLPPGRAGEGAIARFEREVQLTAQLSHPNTVTIFDYGRTPEGVFYYAMELIDGETLEDIVEATGAMPPSRAVRVLLQVAGALGEAHGRALIHRDIKPANVMLSTQGGIPDFVKVLDFGLAQDIAADAATNRSSTSDPVVGTPQYIAPETLAGSNAMTTASDIYAFGAVAFWLLTGKHVFDGTTLLEICAKHLHSPPPSITESCDALIPTQLEELVAACLAKSPEARPTARELVERLRGCCTDEWSEAEAATWWDEHRDEVGRRRRKFLVSEGSETLTVDLARR